MKKIALIAVSILSFVGTSVLPALAAPPYPHRPPPGRYYHGPVHHGYYYNRGHHYYNGHRGYNYYRPGYRNYNGWWYPAAAFAAGAMIGGAIAAQPAPRYAVPAGNAHVQWCMNRYRSYRVSDNTFQPNYGPRQQCVAPY